MKDHHLWPTRGLNTKKIVFKCMMCSFTTSLNAIFAMHMINKHEEILEEDVKIPNISRTAAQTVGMDKDDERVGYYKCYMCDYDLV